VSSCTAATALSLRLTVRRADLIFFFPTESRGKKRSKTLNSPRTRRKRRVTLTNFHSAGKCSQFRFRKLTLSSPLSSLPPSHHFPLHLTQNERTNQTPSQGSCQSQLQRPSLLPRPLQRLGGGRGDEEEWGRKQGEQEQGERCVDSPDLL